MEFSATHFLSFHPQSSEACRSLIMYNILLPCFMETPYWIRSSHRLESLKTSSDKNINVPAVSYLFQLMHIQCPPALQDLCQTLPECSFPPLEIIAC